MSTSVDLRRTSGLVDLGTHTFLVTDRSEEVMPDSGTPGWRLICQVVSPGENEGREIMHQISLGAKSRWKMDEFLDGINAPTKGKMDLGQCIGKKFRASVGSKEYQGKSRSTLETIFPVSKDVNLDAPSETPAEDGALPEDVLPDDDENEAEEKPTRGRF